MANETYQELTWRLSAESDLSNIGNEIKRLSALKNKLKVDSKGEMVTTALIKDMQTIEKLMAKGILDDKDAKKMEEAFQGLSKSAKSFTDVMSKASGVELFNSKQIKNMDEFLKKSEQLESKAKTAFEGIQKSYQKAFDNASNKLQGAGLKPLPASIMANALVGDKNAVENEVKLREGMWNASITKMLEKAGAKFKYDKEALLFNKNGYRDKVLETVSEKDAGKIRAYVDSMTVLHNIMRDMENTFRMFSVLDAFKVFDGKINTENWETIRRAITEVIEERERLAEKAKEDLGEEAVERMGKAAEKAGDEVKGFREEHERLAQSLDNIKEGIANFFALENSIRLFKKAVGEAFETVKALDASMTEIAVVSDYSLDDLWGKRLEFSDEATKLGVSTLDLVDATKLFIQQGLDMAESQQVAIETIKMGRVANISGAEATNLMTGALRGFNMEMTEATRVNDVYSELAAKTASDVNELATAMSKTASIAHNAGASFENTSAFLAQIIEVTREAPETAGTALKTVIARFNELKKPLSEIGEVDGEIVDANKIETALRSAGIALRDAKGEFRALDDVILELAEEWDSLDLMTQRYIATQAAGSRQQSRFIALLSDSKRLLELTDIAANSAGAGQRQFEKTLDSLDSKLNKLKNQLQIFYTGLANNKIIKTAVDSFTGLLTIFNKLTAAATNSQNMALGLFGSALNLGVLGAAFIGVGKVINSSVNVLFKSIEDSATPKIGETIKSLFGFAEQELKRESQSSTVAKEVGNEMGQDFQDGVNEGANEGAKKKSKDDKKGFSLKGFFGIGDSSTLGKVKQVSGTVVAITTALNALLPALINTETKAGKAATNILSLGQSAASGALTGAQFGGVWGAVIGATLAAIPSAIKLVDDLFETTEEKAKRLQQESDKAKENVSKLSETLGKLEGFADGSSIEDRLSGLTKGSTAWREELEKINSEIEELKKVFPDLKLTFDEKLGIDIPAPGEIDRFIKVVREGQNLMSMGQKVLDAQANATPAEYETVYKEGQSGSGQTSETTYGSSYDSSLMDYLDYEIKKVSDASIDLERILTPSSLEGIDSVIADSLTSSGAFNSLALDFISSFEEAINKADFSDEKIVDLIGKETAEAVNEGKNELEKWQILVNKFGGEATDDLADMRAQGQAIIKGHIGESLLKIATGIGESDEIAKALLDGVPTEELEKVIAEGFNLGDTEDDLAKVQAATKQLFDSIQHSLGETKEALEQLGLTKVFEKLFSDLSPAFQNSIGEMILAMEKKLPGQGETFANILGKAIADNPPEKLNEIVNTFKDLAVVDTDEKIDEVAGTLEKLGIKVPTSELTNLVNKLKEVASATNDWVSELSKTAPVVQGILDKAEKGEKEYSKEEHDLLIKDGYANINDFAQRPDGSYYMYGDVGAMGQNIRTQTALQQAQAIQQAQANLTAYQAASPYAKGWNEDLVSGALSYRSVGMSLINKGFSSTQVGATAHQLGTGQFDKQVVEQKVSELVMDILNGGVERAEQRVNDTRALNNQFLTNKKPDAITDDDNMYGATQRLDAYRLAADKITASSEEAAKARERLADAIERQDEAEAKAAYTALRSAELQETIAQNADTIVPKLEELIDKYDQFANMPEPNMAGMADSAREIAEAFNELTGLDVGAEFFNSAENLDLLREAMAGSEEAFQALIDNAWYSQTGIYDLAEQFGLSRDFILQTVTDMNNSPIEMDGSIDLTQIYESLVATLGNVDKAKQALEALAGTKVDFTVEYQSVEMEIPEYIRNGSGSGGPPVGKKTVTNKVPKRIGATISSGNVSSFKDNNLGARLTQPPLATSGAGRLRNASRSGGGGSGGKGSGGKGSGGKGSGGKGGSGNKGAEKEVEPWVQAYDWLYNTVQKTNDLIRQKTKLEREYTKILEKQGVRLADALTNRQRTLNVLKESAKTQKQLLNGRTTEINREMSNNKDLQKYARYDKQLGYVTIDWKAIDAVSNKSGNNELGERIDDYIKNLERIAGQINEAQDTLENIEDQVYDLSLRGRDDIASLESRVIDALDKMFTKEIEKLDTLNQTMSASNQRILAGLQENLNEFRQQRELDKSATNISDMERRLALLQMDSSGSNALEILALQKSIEDAREAHLDSLVDKNIAQMSKDAQLAQEQRQYQIDLMTMQLEQARETGLLAQLGNQAITQSMATEGANIKNAISNAQAKLFSVTGAVPRSLYELLENSELYKGMATVTQQVWKKDLGESITKGFDYWISHNALKDAKGMVGRTIEFTDKAGIKRKGTVQKDGKVKVGNYLYDGIIRGTDGSYFQSNAALISKQQVAKQPMQKPTTPTTTPGKTTAKSKATDIDYKKVAATIWRNATPYQGDWRDEPERTKRLTEVFGASAAKKIQNYINSYVSRGTPNLMEFPLAELKKKYTYGAAKKNFKAFKTGGLADFTGPAWLDGTKTKPELVLNAKDTVNFLELTKVLRQNVQQSGTGNTPSNIYFNIQASLSSDYDVDKMYKRLKEKASSEMGRVNINKLGY